MQINHIFGSNITHDLHRVAFDAYEAIVLSNVRLEDDSIAESIGMGSNVVEILMRDKINGIHIKYALHVPNLRAKLLLVSKILSSSLNVQFNVNECIGNGSDNEAIAIALHEDNVYQMTFTKVRGPDVANLVQLSIWNLSFGIASSNSWMQRMFIDSKA